MILLRSQIEFWKLNYQSGGHHGFRSGEKARNHC